MSPHEEKNQTEADEGMGLQQESSGRWAFIVFNTKRPVSSPRNHDSSELSDF